MGQKLFQEFNISVSSTFYMSSTPFCEFNKFYKFVELHKTHKFCEIHRCHKFHDCCSGTGCAITYKAVRKIVFCIACFAFIVIVVVSSIIIPSFAVLLNYLSVNPRVLFFACFPPHPTAGWGEERVSGCVVLAPGCWVKPRCHQITCIN